jgi:hypothetical protein
MRNRRPPSAGVIYRKKRPERVRPRSLWLHVGIILLITAAAVAASGLLLWALLGRPEFGPPREVPTSAPSVNPKGASLSASERLEAAKVVLAAVGGLGAIVALTVTYRRQRDAEIAEYREDTRVFSDRFARAVELLGHTEYSVRCGGVAALAQLADEWEGGRQTCIDTLCAYLRMPYEPDASSPQYSPGNREVRRIIIREIRNHLRDHWSGQSWRGYRFSFERAVFDCGDLSGAVFRGGNVTFHRAQFVGGWFEFDRVRFLGAGTYFSKAEFSGARVTFHEAEFGDSHVTFEGAKFYQGSIEFDCAHFDSVAQVTFLGATLGAADLSFAGAQRTPGASVEWGPLASQVPLRLR